MIAINNSGLAKLGLPPVDTTLMVPVVTFVADYGAKTITLTSATTVSGADTFLHCNVTINDDEGGTVNGVITTRTGNTGALDISGLELVGPLQIKVIMISTLGIIAVGYYGNVNPGNLTGTVGSYETSFTTAAGI